MVDQIQSTATLSFEDDFEKQFLEWEKQQNVIEGEIVRGTVLAVNKDFVIVDIAYKSEGQIAVSEFTEHDGTVNVKAGDVIDVYVENRENDNGLVELSKEKADRLKIWDEIAEACENEELVEGIITARVKGGLTVDIGVKAFLPGSQVDLRPVRNLEKYIGQRVHFKVIKFNKKRGNIVLSRRALLEKQREALKSQTLNKLEVGMVVDGIVKNITQYGAFIDLGRGHRRPLAHHGHELRAGQPPVRAVRGRPGGQGQGPQVRPRARARQPGPQAELRGPVGQHRAPLPPRPAGQGQGRQPDRPTPAFIEMDAGVEGLIHISEMSWTKRVKHPSKVLSLGDEIEAQILEIDPRSKRISLGMKQIEQNPWDVMAQTSAAKVTGQAVGSKVKGVVRNITNFGIFIGIFIGPKRRQRRHGTTSPT